MQRRRLTPALCTRAQFYTLAASGASTRCTPSPHRRAQSGKRNSRRQPGYAKSCRSRTRCSKSRRLAPTRSSYRRCSGPRRTTRGMRRARLRARSLVRCHLVGRFWLRSTLSGWLRNFDSSLATGDGRALVAVGCAEGVWIGFRHDPRCETCGLVLLNCCSTCLLAAMRRVLHLKMVTQCSMLEDFGIFLVLADKVKLVHILRVIYDLISLYFPFSEVTVRVSYRSTRTLVST